MRLLIAGSRTVSPMIGDIENELRCALAHEFVCLDLITKELVLEIVSGGAKGADMAGEAYAREKQLPCMVFPADWTKHGKAAGKLRNREMADYADAALVFWDGMSSGAADMVCRMVARGKPVKVVPMRKSK